METLEGMTIINKEQWIKDVRALLAEDPNWSWIGVEGCHVLYEDMTREQFASTARALLTISITVPDFNQDYDAETIKAWYIKTATARALFSYGCMIFLPRIQSGNVKTFTSSVIKRWGQTHLERNQAWEALVGYKEPKVADPFLARPARPSGNVHNH
jgi:hypothetical protein